VIEQHNYEFTGVDYPDDTAASSESEGDSAAQASATTERPKLRMEAPKIEMPKRSRSPKPIQMEAKLALPEVKGGPQARR